MPKTKKRKKKQIPKRFQNKTVYEEVSIDDDPPDPDDVVTSIKVFDWLSDVAAQKHANNGGVSLLTVPPAYRMKGKKTGKSAVIVYAPDRDTILIFMSWLECPNKCLLGSTDVGNDRYRLLVGGKFARRALKYTNEK